MSKRAEQLYLSRKLGFGMGFHYTISSVTPLLLIFLITIVLVFSLVFITSISSAIDRMIVLLGSGSIYSKDEIPLSLLPEESSVDYVKKGEGILYSEDGESIVYLKGVDEEYFSPERVSGLRLDATSFENNWIILSSTLADSISVSPGDKMTLLLYEKERGRTRPFLVEIVGIFDSGYAQLDRYMAYITSDLISDSDSGYEVLLPPYADVETVEENLSGYSTRNYRELYSSLYANVQQSTWILYVILIAVALLSVFFSVDISQVYLARDRQDIAMMVLLGLGSKRIKRVYQKMTLIEVFIATITGIGIGILLGTLSPSLVRLVSLFEPAMLEYYITSFSVSIPWFKILIMELLMLSFAYISLQITLIIRDREELLLLVNND